MSNLKNIGNKLFKETTELKSQDVELGLIDDIKSEMKQANAGAISAIDLAFKAIPLAEKSLKLNKNLFKKIQITKKSAIELGASDILKVLQKQETQINSNIKEVEKLIKGLNSI
tara:strand:+ start:361 stop:702 length:342 start_codon:yes stop_codon:yes gene_type:complete